jgi:cell division protein FtsB
LLLTGLFVSALVGCGADIKEENERLKAENTSLKSDNDKLKLEIQKLKEDIQKAAEKDATIASLTGENEALKKQVGDLNAQMAKKKK